MPQKKNQKVWVYVPTAPKFTSDEKKELLTKAQNKLTESPKLSQKVSRIDMRANRVYLYELVEQFNPEGARFIKPLIEDNYLELPYARITLNDKRGDDCTADFQRHNNQWVSLHTGTLMECIEHIESNDMWF